LTIIAVTTANHIIEIRRKIIVIAIGMVSNSGPTSPYPTVVNETTEKYRALKKLFSCVLRCPSMMYAKLLIIIKVTINAFLIP
jgi:hypothetical protein